MSEEALPAAIADPKGERLHPLFLVTGLQRVVRNAWGFLVGGAFLAFQDKMGLALLLLTGVAVLTLGGLLVKWLTFTYRLDEDELHIDQGLISRSSRAIPFDRVTDVDIEQGPLHRLLGLARVRMETGATASAKSEEGVLDTISLERAEAIRDYVRARKRGVVAAPDRDVEQADDTDALFAMDRRRVFTDGVFNFSLAFLAAIVGVSQTFGDVIGFDPFSRAFWFDLLEAAGPFRNYFIAHQFVAIVGGAIVTIAIGVGAGLITTTLREYGFRLDRTDSGFRRRRGLLTLTDVTIPARRVQASLLVTGPIRRAFGWFSLKFQSLAMDDKSGSHVVAPLATEGECAIIQQSLGRPLAPPDDRWRPLPFAHFKSSAAPLIVPSMVVPVASYFISPWLMLALGGVAIAVGAQWLEWRRARWALDGSHFFIDQGWWKQRRAIIPVARIQSIDITENFWTRLFGFRRLRLGIAGGNALSAFQVEALTPADADALRERLLTR
jgi:putative membrane protein